MRSELRLLLFFRAQTTAHIVDKTQRQKKGGTKMNAIIMVIVCVFVRVIMDVVDIQEGRV